MQRLTEISSHWARALALVVPVLIGGCAAVPLNSQAVAPRFYGVWANSNAAIYNWLEIDAHRVVSYGVALGSGACEATTVEAGADRIVLPVGGIGLAPLALHADLLVIAGAHATERYTAASRADICRGSDGLYLAGAPYPAPGT